MISSELSKVYKIALENRFECCFQEYVQIFTEPKFRWKVIYFWLAAISSETKYFWNCKIMFTNVIIIAFYRPNFYCHNQNYKLFRYCHICALMITNVAVVVLLKSPYFELRQRRRMLRDTACCINTKYTTVN